MPKAQSIDLRQKIVDAYDRGGILQRKLAQQFSVTKSFIQKILKQCQETNSIAPKVKLNQTPPKLKEEHRVILAELVEANNDATIAELREQIYNKTGIRVGITTIHNMKKLEITVKKNSLS